MSAIMKETSNSAYTLDIRDIIERFEELESEREDLTEPDEIAEWDKDNGEEFTSLKTLLEELKGEGGDEQWRRDWYPVTLIRDSYFVDAMQELVQDVGDLPQEIPVYLEIDWEATAKNLQVDYSSVEYDGVTYWYR